MRTHGAYTNDETNADKEIILCDKCGEKIKVTYSHDTDYHVCNECSDK